MTTPYPIQSFGGLNITDDPMDVGALAATAMSNVALDTPGLLRTRDGYHQTATTTTAANNLYLHYAEPTAYLISDSATKLEAFTFAGTAIASVACTGLHAITTYGSPGAPVAYAIGRNDSTLRKFNGTAWSTVGGTAPTTGAGIAVMTASNRLVIAGGDRVSFSDAGAPETYGVNNWVDLTPGDGEFIAGACSWQGLVFVWKQSKFFVFYSTSVDADGLPIFNYRTVEGTGLTPEAFRSVLSTPQGVYYISSSGIHLTQGGASTLVSQALSPLFGGGRSSAMQLGTAVNLAWHRGRLFVVLKPLSGDARVFVYYSTANAWAEWDLFDGKGSGAFCGSSHSDAVFFVNGSDSAIYDCSPALTTDNGTAITWSYTSGRYPLSDPGRVAITQESSVIGSGTVSLRNTTDLYGADGSATSMTLGVSPATAEGWHQVDNEGLWFSHTLSGTGPAAVSQLTHHISFIRPPGVR